MLVTSHLMPLKEFQNECSSISNSNSGDWNADNIISTTSSTTTPTPDAFSPPVNSHTDTVLCLTLGYNFYDSISFGKAVQDLMCPGVDDDITVPCGHYLKRCACNK